jgi:hypothetical protein
MRRSCSARRVPYGEYAQQRRFTEASSGVRLRIGANA